jgi:AcrR family transcriptional regulator
VRSDARANRERILVAAEGVFGEAGASGSTEEVARRAGVGVGTVFRHFPTKRDLVEATVVRHFHLLLGRVRELAQGADAAAALRTLIETMVGGAATKLMLVGLLAESGGQTEVALRAAADLRDAVGSLLRRAQHRGGVRPDVSVDEIYLLVRGLSQAFSGPGVTASSRRRTLAVVLDGLAVREG